MLLKTMLHSLCLKATPKSRILWMVEMLHDLLEGYTRNCGNAKSCCR